MVLIQPDYLKTCGTVPGPKDLWQAESNFFENINNLIYSLVLFTAPDR